MASSLAKAGINPNTISVFSTVFAMAGAVTLLCIPSCTTLVTRAELLIATVAAIQLRLLCNLLDGMVAIECGMKTKSGEIFNELPDRISDSLLLVAGGYAIPQSFGAAFGWAAALLAVMTAYVRVLGAATGTAHHFFGPMAKQQRMAVLTTACLVALYENHREWHGYTFTAALTLIILGSIVTVIRRTLRIVKDLEAK